MRIDNKAVRLSTDLFIILGNVFLSYLCYVYTLKLLYARKTECMRVGVFSFIFQGREILQFLELKISKIIFVYK